MQNKKLIVVLGLIILLVGAAAFIGGRMLNQKAGPLDFGGPMAGGDMMSVSIEINPAPELPTTEPEVLGLFAARQDNTIVLQTFSLEAGGGGMVVSSSSAGEGGEGAVAGSSVDTNTGPKVEIVVTSETIIYRETTEFSGPPSGGTETVQQTVEESTLDDLNTQSFVTVWGRKSGDRVIAEVLFYSNPMMIKRP